MARQTGIIKLKGKIGDLSFYKTQDGHLAREKGGVDASRIANDPAFVRTRENGAEFGASAKAGKLLRDTVRSLMMKASDGRVTSRLTKIMSQIRLYDSTNERGNRSVAFGVLDISGRGMLKNFNFNIRSILGSVVFKPYAINTATGEIQILNLIPAIDIAAPQGATHISFTGAWAGVDFGTIQKELVLSNTVNLPLDITLSDVILTIPQAPTVDTTSFNILLVEFFQQINGIQYPLNNGNYNALSILEVTQN